MKELLQKRSAVLARCNELQTLATQRELTTEERTDFDAKLSELRTLNGQIKTAEELEAVAAEQRAAESRVAPELDRQQQQQARGRTAIEVHDNREDEEFRSFGEQLQAIRSAAEDRSAMDPRLRRYDLTNLKVRAAAGLNEGVASEGGFLVMNQVSTELARNAIQESQVWNRASDIQLTGPFNGMKFPTVDETSRADGSRWGGVLAYWSGEAQTMTAKKPKFGEVEVTLQKLTGLCYATDELLQDSGALGQYISQAFTEEFAFKLDDAAIRGTGAGMPLGIMNAPALVTISKEASQAADTVQYLNVSKMRQAMLPRSYARAVWFVNLNVLPQLETMTIPVKNVAGTENVGGNAVFLNGNASQTPFGTLLGRPIVPIEQAASIGDLGDIVLADMGMYRTIGKGGMQMASSIHVKFDTDETAFRFVMRANGQPMVKSSVTPFKGSVALSPFVTLEAR